jgi:meso-butanediol dehydrogenase/(S,S)-butanediol dehydrogenase/diacetyl reductase
MADVSDPDSVREIFVYADRLLGGVDVLAVNAGIAMGRPFLEIAPDEWDRVMAVNLKGVFLCGLASGGWPITTPARRGSCFCPRRW